MKLSHLFVLCCLTACVNFAQAEVYKCTFNGNVSYVTPKEKGNKKGCVKMHLEPLPTMVPPAKTRTPESFPRVDSETQSKRDTTRRKILEDELATEQKDLEEARLKLKDGQDNPEVYKGANGQTFRNVAKYEEKVNALQEDVSVHEKNVEAIKTELSNLK